METEFSKYYERIANHMNDMIPESWETLYLLGEVSKNKMSWSTVFYIDDGSEIYRSHTIPERFSVSREVYDELCDELNHMILELYDCFLKYGQDPWDQISLRLSKEGSFKVHFEYDFLNEVNGGQVNREVIWAYKTCGYVPKEGTYLNKLLQKYLQNI